MNKVHRTVWNEALNAWVAVAEIARAHGKRKRAKRLLAAPLLAALAASAALAGPPNPPAPTTLPTGGVVGAGSATISQTQTPVSAVMTINQSTQRASINWNTFNVGAASTVNFAQPNAQSVTMNRVLDSTPSQIFGKITAPGHVYLVNPSGVYFSPTASVDVGGLVATTHSMSDADFMAGSTTFKRTGATGSIINEGELKAKLDGYIALLAPNVINQGVIVAERGTAILASGESITLDFNAANKLTGIVVTASDVASLIENRQAIETPDGQIIMSAQSISALRGSLIKNSGTLLANEGASSITHKGGRILLEGDEVTLTSSSKIEAKGEAGGGTVLVGGDWQGSNGVYQATKTTMEAGATIDASATLNGDGGKVVLWSDIHNADSVTTVAGSIKADGGPLGGNGGQIETSGYRLYVNGSSVSAEAPLGRAGDWLLDPYDITLYDFSWGATNVTIDTNTGTCSGTTCSFSPGTGNITFPNGFSGGGGDLTLISAGGIFSASHISMSGGVLTFDNAAGSAIYGGYAIGNFTIVKRGVGSLGYSQVNCLNVNAWSCAVHGITVEAGVFSIGSRSVDNQVPIRVLSGGTLEVGYGTDGPGTVRINGNGANGVGAFLMSGDSPGWDSAIILESDSAIGVNAPAGFLNTANAISGNFSLTKVGAGTLVLNGNNTYSGVTNINAGTLETNVNGIGSSGTITFGGGTLKYGGGNTTDYSSRFSLADNQTYSIDTNGRNITFATALNSLGGSLVKNGSGTLTLVEAATYSGPTTIAGGGLFVSQTLADTSAVSIAAGATYTLKTADTVASVHGAGNIVLNADLIAGDSNDTQVSGQISGSGSFTKLGSGTLTLSGTNTYTGVTTVSDGILKLGSVTALGDVASATTVASGAAIDLNGQAYTAAEALTVSGTGVSNSGVLYNSSATGATFGGQLTLGATSSIVATSGAINLTNSGVITGSGFDLTLDGIGVSSLAGILSTDAAALTKLGLGTWILSGANTYTGTTTVNAGILKLGSTSALGDVASGTTVASGAAIDLNGQAYTAAEALTVSGTGVSNSGVLYNSSATGATFGGQLTLGATSSIVATSGAINLTHSGVIAGSGFNLTLDGVGGGTLTGTLNTDTGALTKLGTGTWTLSGANTYTGTTTVSAGILKLGSTSALGDVAGGTTVASGAAIDLNGQAYTAAEALTVSGTGVANSGVLYNSSATGASFGGQLALGATSSIVATSGAIDLTNSGVIAGSGFNLTLDGVGGGTLAGALSTGAGTLTKLATGTWTLSGANTYTGTTTVSAGVLKLASTSALGTTAGGTVISNGAAIDLNGQNYSNAEALTMTGTGVSGGGALFNSSATAATYGGLIYLPSNLSIPTSIIATAGDINISNTGVITSFNNSGEGLILGGGI